MQTQIIKTTLLKNNTGQIDGLPKNPRILKDEKFLKLKKSLTDDPEMLELREVIAYDNNGELVVICGNMRLRALKDLGITEVPTKILPKDTPIEKLKAYTIKDNVGFGEHDWDMLANEWDAEELTEWGLDIPNWSTGHSVNTELEESNLDMNEEFDPIGDSNGQKKIVLTFDDEYAANSWLDKFTEYKQIIVKQGQAWQINLCTQSI